MDKCYRCKKNQCSQGYPADSPNPVNSKAQKILKISTTNAKGLEIQCCVKCISPKSREPLHNREVFIRPENMFLNYIVDKLDGILKTEKTFNEVEITQTNPDKEDKYDLLVKKDSRYILVEVDERQHFVKKQFHEDRNREKRFWTKYGNENAVIRIRVGDAPGEEMYSCISRTGGRGGGCSVKNSSMFSKNMNDIVKHIKDYFNKKNVIKHAYIEFFNTIGIQDFKKAFNHTKATITHESQYAFVSYPNELKIEEVTSKMEALSVNPLGKKIDCIKNRCKERTSSKSGLCSKHR